MSCYEALASSYDALTEDVGYEKRADFLEKLFCRSRIPVKVVLDLACGTGTMTWLLTGRGYELIGVDGIWWAITVAEVFAFVISLLFLFVKRKQYHYMDAEV